MEIFKARPGVVLTEIAGEYVIIAVKALMDTCPYVMQINESSAFLWKRLESGADLDELVSAVSEEFELDDPDAAREAIREFVQQMADLNYLTVKKQEDYHDEDEKEK